MTTHRSKNLSKNSSPTTPSVNQPPTPIYEDNNLIVYCECDEDHVADVSLELLTKGRVLADKLGVKLEALVIGDKLDGIEKQIFPYGADTVYKIEDKRLYPLYLESPFRCAHQAFPRNQTADLPYGSNLHRPRPRSPCQLVPAQRTHGRLHRLEIGDHKDAKTRQEYTDLLATRYVRRSAAISWPPIVNPDCRPQMATVREGVMKKRSSDRRPQR